MSWTVPKTWAVGDPATSTDLNTYVRDNTNFLHQAAIVAEIDGSAAGGSPPSPATGGILTKVGYAEVGTNSSSEATITFSTPFPNGIVGVVCTPVFDSGHTLQNVSSIETLLPTAAGFTVIAYFGSAGVGVTTIGFSWIAYGW